MTDSHLLQFLPLLGFVVILAFFFAKVEIWHWSLELEARILASMMVFWIVEDFLWFIVNPAFGWKRFHQQHVPWHKHWICGAPTDYWVFIGISGLLFAYKG